ncbi:MAG: primosomal protein N' [Candidatus Cryptobacteroides sp.]
MPGSKIYIKVILPLKLEWEPCYYIDSDNIIPNKTVTGTDNITATDNIIGTGTGKTTDTVTASETPKSTVTPGQRVRVNFGSKEYLGVISAVNVTPEVAPSQIRSINSIETGMEPVSEGEIALWRAVADYYLCTVGEVYKAAYPFGKINLEENLARSEERKALRDKIKTEKEAEAFRKKVARLEERIESRIAEAEKAVKKEKKERLQREIEALKEQMTAIMSVDNTEEHQIEKTESNIGGLPTLSERQKEAYDKIREAFALHKTVLLDGVTGSGKTEIYITLAAETILSGKNVLYLVPEIAMSRQLEERLSKVYGDGLMVFHSAETAARRRDIAGRIRNWNTNNSNYGYIILGTRSSLFLPHHNLGLVIVDEEHDSSYKQDSPAPRYNGRDTAVMLGGLNDGCNVLLGSATPSLESIYNSQTGRYVKVDLNDKYHGNALVRTEIIDTVAERKKHGMDGSFSFRLIKYIRKALEEGVQVLVLRARRSYSPVVQCTECGSIPKCPRCNVSLSYHKDKGRMVCHHCGYTKVFDGFCPECGGTLGFIGAGTQKIEEELQNLFPDARILRMDSDTLGSNVSGKEKIKDFESGRADIIVGTQMITKGFDFENLGLVAALQADALVSIQDFRADEKAFQLLEQFKGRCGRRGKEGLFVIQTSRPGHPIYKMISDGDSNAGNFDNQMLRERKDFNYPPFTRLINISVKDSFAERAERLADALSNHLKAVLNMESIAEITDAYAPPIDRKGNLYERIIRISLRKDRHLSEVKRRLVKILEEYEASHNCRGRITVNVDPA